MVINYSHKIWKSWNICIWWHMHILLIFSKSISLLLIYLIFLSDISLLSIRYFGQFNLIYIICVDASYLFIFSWDQSILNIWPPSPWPDRLNCPSNSSKPWLLGRVMGPWISCTQNDLNFEWSQWIWGV